MGISDAGAQNVPKGPLASVKKPTIATRRATITIFGEAFTATCPPGSEMLPQQYSTSTVAFTSRRRQPLKAADSLRQSPKAPVRVSWVFLKNGGRGERI